MRASLIFFCISALILHSACSREPKKPVASEAEGEKVGSVSEADALAQEEAAADGKIDCAVSGAKEFTRDCEIERVASDTGQLLVIRHPDGGFRRYRVLTNGKGVEAAEGADPTQVSVIDKDWIEVSTAADRYRLPARVEGKAAPKTELPAQKGE